MFKQSKDNKNCYNFKAGNKTIEVFFAEDDDNIEVYDLNNPLKTGFVFSDSTQLISFINNLTDVAESHLGD